MNMNISVSLSGDMRKTPSSIAIRFVASNIDAVAPMLADDVVWHEPGGAGAIEGRSPLLEQMRWVTSNSKEIGVHDVLANDDHTVGLVEWRVPSIPNNREDRERAREGCSQQQKDSP